VSKNVLLLFVMKLEIVDMFLTGGGGAVEFPVTWNNI
jgi:hypothetical protein